jgi:hypothetical protein
MYSGSPEGLSRPAQINDDDDKNNNNNNYRKWKTA